VGLRGSDIGGLNGGAALILSLHTNGTVKREWALHDGVQLGSAVALAVREMFFVFSSLRSHTHTTHCVQLGTRSQPARFSAVPSLIWVNFLPEPRLWRSEHVGKTAATA
jgi:hypothetical protein